MKRDTTARTTPYMNRVKILVNTAVIQEKTLTHHRVVNHQKLMKIAALLAAEIKVSPDMFKSAYQAIGG